MKYLSPEVKNIGLKPKFTALYSSTNKRMSVSALYLHGLKPRIRRNRFVTRGIPAEMRSISTTSFTKSGGVNRAKPFPEFTK